MNQTYDNIPQEKFEFAQLNDTLHDKKLETKSRGYFSDALIRFKKNKSSSVAAYIILFLILFAIFAPIISPYSVYDTDTTYQKFAPFAESIANMGLGFLDGSKTLSSQSETQIKFYEGIAKETGKNPIIKIDYDNPKITTTIIRGKKVQIKTYPININSYYAVGVVFKNISYEEFAKIQEFQNISGLQVLYPYTEKSSIYDGIDPAKYKDLPENSNIWYVCSDTKGTPKLDSDGNFIPAYSTDAKKAGPEEYATYTSQRIAGDDGSYIYSWGKSGSLSVRVEYYNYYQYMQWAKTGSYHPPMYLFGTSENGTDLFCAIGAGARFSLIFAILVSVINLTIGAIYGAIQGYYGGYIDLAMDRVTDILSEVPFVVVTTLFQLHLAQRVGSVVSFLFAFVLTGWIGMAALTRKQFYRFKSQEFVYAAKTLGASDWRLMFKHIFPNSLGTIVTSCALVIPSVISSETSLTYLGIVNLKSFAGTSIGALLSEGQTAITSAPHAMLFPSLFISLLLISFNLFGNGLRDAFNPTTRGMED